MNWREIKTSPHEEILAWADEQPWARAMAACAQDRGWHAEGRTVIAVLHDLALVLAEFPETLLIAREPIAWGPTALALAPANRQRARMAVEAWAPDPALCRTAA